MIDVQSSASGHDYASDRSAIGLAPKFQDMKTSSQGRENLSVLGLYICLQINQLIVGLLCLGYILSYATKMHILDIQTELGYCVAIRFNRVCEYFALGGS